MTTSETAKIPFNLLYTIKSYSIFLLIFLIKKCVSARNNRTRMKCLFACGLFYAKCVVFTGSECEFTIIIITLLCK